MRKGSTGSRDGDQEKGSHIVLIKAGVGVPLEEVKIPGNTPLRQVLVDGVTYEHVDEDNKGRWIYRHF